MVRMKDGERTGLSWLGGVVVEFVALYPNTHIIFLVCEYDHRFMLSSLSCWFQSHERYLHFHPHNRQRWNIQQSTRPQTVLWRFAPIGQKKKPSCTEETDLSPVSMASMHSNRHFNPCRIGRVTCVWSQGVFVDALTFSLDIR
jgi:hypothetical protein